MGANGRTGDYKARRATRQRLCRGQTFVYTQGYRTRHRARSRWPRIPAVTDHHAVIAKRICIRTIAAQLDATVVHAAQVARAAYLGLSVDADRPGSIRTSADHGFNVVHNAGQGRGSRGQLGAVHIIEDEPPQAVQVKETFSIAAGILEVADRRVASHSLFRVQEVETIVSGTEVVIALLVLPDLDVGNAVLPVQPGAVFAKHHGDDYDGCITFTGTLTKIARLKLHVLEKASRTCRRTHADGHHPVGGSNYARGTNSRDSRRYQG